MIKSLPWHFQQSWWGENLKILYGPEEAKDKSESDPFASSEDTDEEECDGEDSE